MTLLFDISSITPTTGGGGGGSANLTTLDVNPTTSTQSITPNTGYDGFNIVNVSAVNALIDANITASNIKQGVDILGVTGDYTGEGSDSSELARYTVQNGTASTITTIPANAFSNITTIGNRALYRAYSYVTFDNNTSLDMSSVQSIGQEGMREALYMSTGIVSIDLSSLVTVGNSGLRSLVGYQGPYTLASVDLSSLVTIGDNGMSSAFSSQENLSLFDISSVQTIGRNGMSGVCDSCTSLTSVDLSSIVSVGNAGLSSAFYNCDLRTVSFDSLSYIGDNALSGCFGENYNLSSVSFPSLTSNSFTYEDEEGYCFDSMLSSCSNVTVHFPSNLQSVIGSWNSVVDGFSGNNTTVLFDLPATE